MKSPKPIRNARRRTGVSARRRAAAKVPASGPSPNVELRYQGRATLREVLLPAGGWHCTSSQQYGEPTSGWTNRLIDGDNLAAMRMLLNDASVAGCVTLAYVDPPFATGNEFRVGRRAATVSRSAAGDLAYADRFELAAYLEFVRCRLILVKELLGPRGSIWVHIGHQMAHYIRVLMDEVFGAENFLNEIARVKCNPKNFSRRAFGNIKDTLLYYSRSGDHVWNEQRERMSEDDLARLFPRLDRQGRRYTTTPLHAPGETRGGPTGQPWKGLNPPEGRHWRYAPEELSRLDEAGKIEWSASGNPRKIVYADDVRVAGKKRQDIWTYKDPAYPRYPTEKNTALLKHLVLTSSDPGDLVLDCFAGSGATLEAAAAHGRRWIGIDSSPLAICQATERLRSLAEAPPFRVETLRPS